MANSSGTTHIVGPLAEAQARAGCAVSLFCVGKGAIPPVLPDPGLVDSRCFKQTLSLDNPGFSLCFARALSREIRSFDIVHVHAIWNFPSWWTMRAACRAQVPFIVAPQGSLDPWALQQNRWGKKLYGGLTEVPLVRQAACLQALTRKEARQFLEYGLPVDYEIIPNGVKEELMDRNRAPNPGYFGMPPECRTLLFLSRIHPKKGLDLLVQAAQSVRHSHPTLRFVVAGGDGGSGYLSALKSKCLSLGVSDMFIFLGEVEGDQKLEVLTAADAFVLPSYSEGLPVAVLEALAVGLPAVITDECNLPEVAGLGAGYVVTPESVCIASAIQQLFSLSDDQRRHMGKSGRELIAERYTWSRISRQTLACYQHLLESKVA